MWRRNSKAADYLQDSLYFLYNSPSSCWHYVHPPSAISFTHYVAFFFLTFPLWRAPECVLYLERDSWKPPASPLWAVLCHLSYFSWPRSVGRFSVRPSICVALRQLDVRFQGWIHHHKRLQMVRCSPRPPNSTRFPEVLGDCRANLRFAGVVQTDDPSCFLGSLSHPDGGRSRD